MMSNEEVLTWQAEVTTFGDTFRVPSSWLGGVHVGYCGCGFWARLHDVEDGRGNVVNYACSACHDPATGRHRAMWRVRNPSLSYGDAA